MSYSDRVKCTSCDGSGTTGEHGCTDCLGKGLDHMAFVGGIEQALNDAYAEGRQDERTEWEGRILPLLVELEEREYLSEQQCAKFFGGDLLDWRVARDGPAHQRSTPSPLPPLAG